MERCVPGCGLVRRGRPCFDYVRVCVNLSRGQTKIPNVCAGEPSSAMTHPSDSHSEPTSLFRLLISTAVFGSSEPRPQSRSHEPGQPVQQQQSRLTQRAHIPADDRGRRPRLPAQRHAVHFPCHSSFCLLAWPAARPSACGNAKGI